MYSCPSAIQHLASCIPAALGPRYCKMYARQALEIKNASINNRHPSLLSYTLFNTKYCFYRPMPKSSSTSKNQPQMAYTGVKPQLRTMKKQGLETKLKGTMGWKILKWRTSRLSLLGTQCTLQPRNLRTCPFLSLFYRCAPLKLPGLIQISYTLSLKSRIQKQWLILSRRGEIGIAVASCGETLNGKASLLPVGELTPVKLEGRSSEIRKDFVSDQSIIPGLSCNMKSSLVVAWLDL